LDSLRPGHGLETRETAAQNNTAVASARTGWTSK
jgi:hypothetical protein